MKLLAHGRSSIAVIMRLSAVYDLRQGPSPLEASAFPIWKMERTLSVMWKLNRPRREKPVLALGAQSAWAATTMTPSFPAELHRPESGGAVRGAQAPVASEAGSQFLP